MKPLVKQEVQDKLLVLVNRYRRSKKCISAKTLGEWLNITPLMCGLVIRQLHIPLKKEKRYVGRWIEYKGKKVYRAKYTTQIIYTFI